MPRIKLALGLLAALLCAPQLANAQATRTWVSGVGDDANPCSRTAPCKTFAGAISKTAAGGEISALDPGGYGAVTITKSITIAAEGSGSAGILASGTTGVIINASASDRIVLRGLQLDGGPPASPGVNGIRVIQAASVIVENCVVRNFRGASPNGYGILMQSPGSLVVSDSTISSNGAGAGSGGGILVVPGSGGAKVSLMRTNLIGNTFGLKADATNGTANVTIDSSTASSNLQSGFSAFSGGLSVDMQVSRSTIVNNATGLNANGPAASLRIGSSVVSGNNNSAQIQNSADVVSYGNNQIDGNVGGATIPIISLK